MTRRFFGRLLPVLMVLPALHITGQTSSSRATRTAQANISSERMRAHLQFLADDLLEGRMPGLRGGALAAKYIASQFALAGLTPGGDGGTYMQRVNLIGTRVIPETVSFEAVKSDGTTLAFRYGDDFIPTNFDDDGLVSLDAPIVFVGYGIDAPEFNWHDYDGTDLRGKIALVIVGDPPSDDPSFFMGKTLTYYGRWTYKLEEAARRGAIGVIIIHRTDLASYDWSVVRRSFAGEKMTLSQDMAPKVRSWSWMNLEAARRLLSLASLDLNNEIDAAGKTGFRAITLPVRLKAYIPSESRSVTTENVIGILRGSGFNTKQQCATCTHGIDQAVLYTAHYDHLGIRPGLKGNDIFNGAIDNATGCAAVLELAKAWTSMGTRPPHSIIFALVTAEEQNLLGSRYLGEHPPLPTGQIALDLNFDALPLLGVPQEITVTGAEQTSFYSVVQSIATRFHLATVPDPRPEDGEYYRSDHFSLSRVGIPSFSIGEGDLYIGHSRDWGSEKVRDYDENRYHNVSDKYSPDMDFAGLVKLAQFGMALGWEAVTAKDTIVWTKGSEFATIRRRSLAKIGKADLQP